MLIHVHTDISQSDANKRQDAAVRANNAPMTARFYFGYWFSHWRA